MELQTPHYFKEILEQNSALTGLVNSSISEFGPWLERNNVRFFTEYTDHSLKHVEEVLRESDELIRDQCRGIFTPADVATLTLATLLHDCAMHLTVDGFIDLVQGAIALPVVAHAESRDVFRVLAIVDQFCRRLRPSRCRPNKE